MARLNSFTEYIFRKWNIDISRVNLLPINGFDGKNHRYAYPFGIRDISFRNSWLPDVRFKNCVVTGKGLKYVTNFTHCHKKLRCNSCVHTFSLVEHLLPPRRQLSDSEKARLFSVIRSVM